jgi:hypothetical protein
MSSPLDERAPSAPGDPAPIDPAPTRPTLDRGLRWLAGALVVLGCGLRTFRPEADPDYYGWWGHLFDEGRWVEQARHVVLFGRLPDELGHNALVAPLFELATTVVFAIGGVSFTTARLFSMVCGSALVIVAWAWLRPRVRPAALVVGVALIALPADLVVMSRIAIPEAGAMLGTAIAFGLLCTRRPAPLPLFVAGVATAAAVGLKLTALFIALVFVAVAFSLRERGSPLSARVRDVLWFGGGIALPALLAFGLALAVMLRLDLDPARFFNKLAPFLVLRDFYSIVTLPFFTLDAPVVVASGLSLWLAGLVWLGGSPRDADRARWLRAAVTWTVVWIAVYALQGYFPSYYRIHVLVPMALVAALATDAGLREGWNGLRRRLRTGPLPARAATIAWLGAVAGVHLGALPTAAAPSLGLDFERLSTRLIALGLGFAVTIAVLWPRRERRHLVGAVIAFSVTATALHFAHWIVRPYDVELFVRDPAEALARVGLLGVAAGAAFAFVRLDAGGRARAPATVLATALVGLAWTIHLGPGLLAPTYTLRDASVAVGEILAGEDDVFQHRAESLFIANRLAYRPMHLPEQKQWPPPIVVTDLPLARDGGFLASHYLRTHAFEIHVPAGHFTPPPRSGVCPGPGQCFGIFRREDPGDTPVSAPGDARGPG